MQLSPRFKLQCKELPLSSAVVFLIGPNGSGKSSYLKKINEQPEILNLMLPAHNAFAESVYLSELFDIYEVDRQNTSPLFSPNDWLDQELNQLSSGERQRLLLHLHLNHKLSFQLLDEPTNFLDPLHKHQLRSFIEESCPNKQFLIATHDLAWACQFKNAYFVLLNEGSIINQGPCKDLVESPEMQKAFRMIFHVTDNHHIESKPLSS